MRSKINFYIKINNMITTIIVIIYYHYYFCNIYIHMYILEHGNIYMNIYFIHVSNINVLYVHTHILYLSLYWGRWPRRRCPCWCSSRSGPCSRTAQNPTHTHTCTEPVKATQEIKIFYCLLFSRKNCVQAEDFILLRDRKKKHKKR